MNAEQDSRTEAERSADSHFQVFHDRLAQFIERNHYVRRSRLTPRL